MTNIQLACYSLIASAFILAGMLVFAVSGQLEQRADAAMVIAEGSFSLMTAQTKSGEESLMVLDNVSGVLMVYRLELSKRELEFVDGISVAQLFGAQ